MNSPHASTVLPCQWDLLHFWLRGVYTLVLHFPPTPFGGNKLFPNPSAHAARLEEVFSTSSCADGRVCSELVPRACMVLAQAVLEHSGSEAAQGRTGSVEQSAREGEGKGAAQKEHLVPVQVTLSGSTAPAELLEHTQMHISPKCTGTALAPAGVPAGWHAQLLPAGSSPGESPTQSGLPGQAAAELSPCPVPGPFPCTPIWLGAPQHLFERNTRRNTHSPLPGREGRPAVCWLFQRACKPPQISQGLRAAGRGRERGQFKVTIDLSFPPSHFSAPA